MQKIKVHLFMSVIVNIIYSLFIFLKLKSSIAVNFQFNGLPNPNSYQSSLNYAAMQIVLCIVIAILFLMLPWLVKTLPIKYVNIPNRNKWLRGEERDKSLKKLNFMLLLLGTVLIYFLTAMSMVVYIANISTPLVLPILPFFSILLIFLGFLITWIVKLYKLFP